MSASISKFVKAIIKHINNAFHVRTLVHATWWVAFALIIWIIVTHLPEDSPYWQRILLGFFGSLLFFVIMSIRQWLLNLLADINGVPVKNVSLYVFGGASRVPKNVTRPLFELISAIVGLLLNVIIAGIFQLLWLKESIASNPLIGVVIEWSAFFWYILAIFHLLPGFPLEAGKILLALIWKATGKYIRAVRISAWVGRFIGIAFIFSGIALVVIERQTVNGLSMALFGWVLQIAARDTLNRAMLLDSLHNAHSEDVMTREYPVISSELSLDKLVTNYALVTGHDYFIVAESNALKGVVTLAAIKKIRKKEWASTAVEEIMIPVRKVKTVQAGEPAANAIERMDQWKIDEVPVLNKNEFIGTVVRGRLLRLARTRAELRI